MLSPVVCDSKGPIGMATRLNLQGNGHHSHTKHFACINTRYVTQALMHQLLTHQPKQTYYLYALPQIVFVCLRLSLDFAPQGYKLSILGSPLEASD